MLEHLAKQDFDVIFGLLEASFPIDEYRSYGEQKALLEDEIYRILVQKEQGCIRAFAALWDLGDFVYIDHLVVRPEDRSRGLGALILQELLQQAGKPIILEVEPPEDELCRRRIGFYQRNGFFLNPWPYWQPPISPGKKSIPLRIMSSGRILSPAEFAAVQEKLYSRVYKQPDFPTKPGSS